MSYTDWTIMLGTLFFIVAYGAWKTSGSKNIEGFLKGDNSAKWWTIGLSVMATQASAITFISTPGQGFASGMSFVQFYFGLPIAMIIISVVFIPLFYRLKVYTAYEFLENRFDRKTRVLTALLFLLQRGLAAGITIYAPAIILSHILGWTLNFTVIFIGILVIIYTVSGGTRAVSQTHRHQMAVIFGGMFIAFGILVWHLSEYASFGEAVRVAGQMGRMNIIDTSLDFGSRYNIWSGIIGGLFLQLAYFGTDQSQVQRYISGQSNRESRLGLMFNGMMKIPMQFFILLTGVLVFVFYLFNPSPINFNQQGLDAVHSSEKAEQLEELKTEHERIFVERKNEALSMVEHIRNGNDAALADSRSRLLELDQTSNEIREETKTLINTVDNDAETNDTDYVFITFITNILPIGVVGLLMAVIFSAAMSSTSAELNALASTTTVDIYKRNFKNKGSEKHYLIMSRLFTALFGVLAISFALMASLFENLIQAVNILGSIFYGTVLGVFITAFFLKWVRGTAVFIGALIAQACVIAVYFMDQHGIVAVEFLWLNLIGCVLVALFANIVQLMNGGLRD